MSDAEGPPSTTFAANGVRLVHEGLEALVAPELAAEVLATALRRADLETPPDNGRELAAFVGGPLWTALEARAGRDIAEALVERLAPLLAALATGPMSSRPPGSATKPSKRISATDASPRVGIDFVVIGFGDESPDLVALLPRSSSVRVAREAKEVAEIADRGLIKRWTVALVDATDPALLGIARTVLRETGPHVVLRGASDWQRDNVRAELHARNASLVVAGEGDTLAELALAARMLAAREP